MDHAHAPGWYAAVTGLGRKPRASRRPAGIEALAAGVLCLCFVLPPLALADDGGKSLYLLGKRGPLAAFVPKPGFYVTNDVYWYDGSSSDFLPLGDLVAQDVSAQALMDIPQFTWVTDVTLGGGRLAFSAVVPFGSIDVSGQGTLQLQDGAGPSLEVSDTDSGFGDPVVGSSVGWKKRDGDKFRAWSVYSALYIPIGSYEVGRLANLSGNRWGLDVGGAYTMANFKRGRELSAVLGFTFNGDNQDTDYSSGTDMHLEISGRQHLPNNWAFGIVGYWFQQLTADGNNPAILGDFKGRVFGLGPELSYQFPNKVHPVGLDLRWYHEFGAENRLEGDGVFLTLSVPLRVTPARNASEDWTQAEEGTP
jgi:hypothetical protein